jgi:TolB-like protein
MFAQAERQQRFLRYILAETLAGRAEKLKGYTIGVEVFDRESSFDPAVDAIVRVEAARLRTKLREYYAADGHADKVRFDLPKGAYAVCIAWQQLDAAQALATKPPGAPSPAVHNANTGNLSTHVYQIVDKPSLAVLPFANMSSDPEQEYFADGITECLITELSRLGGLFIISRHSSFVYKGVTKRAEEIGSELGVRYLLEGSVQRAEGWVRITAQLVDTKSGAHLWAEHYNRQLEDIFAVQDDVTQRIATILQVKLSADEGQRHNYGGTASMEAHDCLLRGLERLWSYERTSVEQAQTHFERALALDPGYAAAHVWLARVLTMRWIFFWDDRDETLERAFEHVRMALDIDPQLPIAHAVMCWVQRWRGQKDAAIDAGRRAVVMDPNNADAHLFLSTALSAANFGQEALHYIETGMRLNPHPSTFYQFALGLCYFVLEDYDKALQAFERGAALTEPFIPNHVWLCIMYTLLGQDDKAAIEREKALTLSGGRRPTVQPIWLDEGLSLRTHDLIQRVGLA